MSPVWAEPPRVKLPDPLDPYADVVPIPFYPPDLPRIVWHYLSPHQLDYVLQQQRDMLFPEVATP